MRYAHFIDLLDWSVPTIPPVAVHGRNQPFKY